MGVSKDWGRYCSQLHMSSLLSSPVSSIVVDCPNVNNRHVVDVLRLPSPYPFTLRCATRAESGWPSNALGSAASL